MAGLYARLIESARRAGEPLDALIELTYRCNYHCSFCYVNHTAVAAKAELDSAAWGRILEGLRAAGVISALFTGGEVFVRNDCLEILRRAKELGFLATVFTNASRVDQQTCVDLARLNLVNVGVTLYGATPATHDRYTGDCGSFDRVILALRTMKDLGCNLTLRWQAIPESIHESEAFINLAEGMGIRWKFNGLITCGRDGLCRPRVSDDELMAFYRTAAARLYSPEQLLEDAAQIAASLRVAPDPESRMCAVGTAGVRIGPEGMLYPCMEIHEAVGNLAQTPFAELWGRVLAWAGCPDLKRRQSASCASCGYAGACSVCPGGFALETGSYQQATWEYCRNTLFRIRAIAERVDQVFGREANPLGARTEEACGLQSATTRR